MQQFEFVRKTISITYRIKRYSWFALAIIIVVFKPFINQVVCNLEKNEKDIYYYRETIVKSLENRSVDLLTISSYKGVSEERECRLFGLFPDENKPRPHIFKNKKV